MYIYIFATKQIEINIKILNKRSKVTNTDQIKKKNPDRNHFVRGLTTTWLLFLKSSIEFKSKWRGFADLFFLAYLYIDFNRFKNVH